LAPVAGYTYRFSCAGELGKGCCPDEGASGVDKSHLQTTEVFVETHLIRRNRYKPQDSLRRRDGRIGQAISDACRTVYRDDRAGGASVRDQGRTIFKSGLLLPPMSGSICKMICTMNEKDLDPSRRWEMALRDVPQNLMQFCAK
jgi:hypothetical protein